MIYYIYLCICHNIRYTTICGIYTIIIFEFPWVFFFNWTELYRDSNNALLFHLNNPPVQEYVQKHANLAESLSIEIYGNVSEEAINALNSMEIPIKNYKTSNVGFIRSSILK